MARRDKDLMKSVQRFGRKWTLFRVSTDCISTRITGYEPRILHLAGISNSFQLKIEIYFSFLFSLIVKTVLQKSHSVEMKKRA